MVFIALESIKYLRKNFPEKLSETVNSPKHFQDSLVSTVLFAKFLVKDETPAQKQKPTENYSVLIGDLFCYVRRQTEKFLRSDALLCVFSYSEWSLHSHYLIWSDIQHLFCLKNHKRAFLSKINYFLIDIPF